MANMFKSRLNSGSFTPVGNALPEEVIAGKVFMNASGVQTGTMVDNGAVSGTATSETPYVIPEGYHNGEGTVTAESSALTLTIKGNASQSYYNNDNGSTSSGNKSVSFTLVYEISGNTITLKSGNTSGQSATGVPSGNMKPWATAYNITSVTIE